MEKNKWSGAGAEEGENRASFSDLPHTMEHGENGKESKKDREVGRSRGGGG